MTTERLSSSNATWATTLFGRGPWLALGLTWLAYLAGSDPTFELDRSAVLAGEWWRIFTSHFVHYGLAHSRGDIWAFAVWALVTEAISRRLLAIAVVTACSVIGVGVLVACPGVAHYGGLSGVDVALFVVLSCAAWEKLPRGRAWVLLGLLGLLAKTAYEVVIERAILAPDLGDGVRVLPAAHAFGAVAGIVAWRIERSVKSRAP